MRILYEDNHLLAVEKPVNVPTQSDASGDPDMLTILKQDLKARYNKPGNVFLGLVHRLDRPVGGAMVFAKTSKAASRLSDAIRRGQMEKHYIAVVHGSPPADSGTLQHYLLKNPRQNIVQVVSGQQKGAKKALLDYRLASYENGLSLVYIRLITGRPHQIRVQFAEIGCPLYGDQKYGANRNRRGQQIALWSCRLTVPHPITREAVTFTSWPDEERPPWQQWNQRLLSLSGSAEASLPSR